MDVAWKIAICCVRRIRTGEESEMMEKNSCQNWNVSHASSPSEKCVWQSSCVSPDPPAPNRLSAISGCMQFHAFSLMHRYSQVRGKPLVHRDRDRSSRQRMASPDSCEKKYNSRRRIIRIEILSLTWSAVMRVIFALLVKRIPHHSSDMRDDWESERHDFRTWFPDHEATGETIWHANRLVDFDGGNFWESFHPFLRGERQKHMASSNDLWSGSGRFDCVTKRAAVSQCSRWNSFIPASRIC